MKARTLLFALNCAAFKRHLWHWLHTILLVVAIRSISTEAGNLKGAKQRNSTTQVLPVSLRESIVLRSCEKTKLLSGIFFHLIYQLIFQHLTK